MEKKTDNILFGESYLYSEFNSWRRNRFK